MKHRNGRKSSYRLCCQQRHPTMGCIEMLVRMCLGDLIRMVAGTRTRIWKKPEQNWQIPTPSLHLMRHVRDSRSSAQTTRWARTQPVDQPIHEQSHGLHRMRCCHKLAKTKYFRAFLRPYQSSTVGLSSYVLPPSSSQQIWMILLRQMS